MSFKKVIFFVSSIMCASAAPQFGYNGYPMSSPYGYNMSPYQPFGYSPYGNQGYPGQWNNGWGGNGNGFQQDLRQIGQGFTNLMGDLYNRGGGNYYGNQFG